MHDPTALQADLAILDAYSDVIAWTDGRDGRIGYLIHDNPIGLSIARYGEWSGIELDYHLHFITEDAVVLDVGANVGVHSLAYAARAKAGRVLLFEPQPLLLAMALKTLEANDLMHIQGYRAAISSKVGTARFRFPDYGSLGNFGMVREIKGGESGPDLVTVPTLPIDSLDLGRCDFIKIDAEGASVDVLQSAARTVQRCLPVIATEVLGVEDGWRIMEWFHSLDCGYTARFYRFSCYNARNSLGDKLNFLGMAEECGLLFVPPGGVDSFAANGFFATTVTTLDELAREHQRTARYGDFTPFDRKNEVIGSLYVDLLRRMLPVYATSTRTDVCVGDEGWGGVQAAVQVWDEHVHKMSDRAAGAADTPWLDTVLADIDRRERELAAQREAIAAEAGELAERSAQSERLCEQRQGELLAQLNRLAEREATLDEAGAELAEREAALAERAITLRQAEVNLGKAEAAVEKSEASLAERGEEQARQGVALAQREAVLSKRERELDENLGLIRLRSAELDRVAAEHALAVVKLEAERKDLEAAMTQLDRATAEIEGRRQALESRARIVSDREAALEGREQSLAQRHGELQLRHGRLEQHERECEDLARHNARKEAEHKRTAQSLSEERARLSERAMELDALQCRLQTLASEIPG